MKLKYNILAWLSLLCCINGSAQNAISHFEYWTDKQFDQRQTVASADGTLAMELDLSTMQKGLHGISFRAVDSNGKTSPVFHRLFLVANAPVTQTNSISHFEYWTDKQFDRRQTVASADGTLALELDVSTMQKGLHGISFRAVDSNGQASPVFHRLFLVSDAVEGGQPLIASYAFWFNNGPRQHVDVAPTMQLVVDTADIEMTGRIVPDFIPTEYQFDVANQQIAFTTDVRVGLQVFNTVGVGSPAVVDTLKNHLVRINLNAIDLQPDVSATTPSPTGGNIITYGYDCAQGDSIHITVEGTARIDLYDDEGNAISYREIDSDAAPAKAWRSPATDVPMRTLAFTATTGKVYALLYGSEQVMEQTTVTLGIVVPTGIDDASFFSADTLPPYIYTLSGVCISTNGMRLNQLKPGIYIVNGKKLVVKR